MPAGTVGCAYSNVKDVVRTRGANNISQNISKQKKVALKLKDFFKSATQ